MLAQLSALGTSSTITSSVLSGGTAPVSVLSGPSEGSKGGGAIMVGGGSGKSAKVP